MKTDHDRIQLVNAAHNLTKILATMPGGLVTMRTNMLAGVAGIRGQNFNAVGTSSSDISDPTHNAALTNDPATRALENLDVLLLALYRTVQDLAGLHDQWVPRAGATRPLDEEDGPGPDWCSSCWRDNRTCTPVEHYKGMCRWCGDFRAAHGQAPSLPILRARHRGEAITKRMLKRYGAVKRAS